MPDAADITIAGLGPGSEGCRTIELESALARAQTIVVRTKTHPGLDWLDRFSNVVACDDIYESTGSFEAVYVAVADRVLSAATRGPVVFLVPGSPLFGESSVQVLLTMARDAGLDCRTLCSASGLDAIAAEISIDLLVDQVQILDAVELARSLNDDPFSGGGPSFDPARPLIVGQVYAKEIASQVKMILSRRFPEDHPVTIVASAGIARNAQVLTVPLHELDHAQFDHLTSVVVSPLERLDATRSPFTLQYIVGFLRSPEGCAWDRKQTTASLRDKMLEEAAEVVDAIDEDRPAELAGELGDVLLLVYMMAQIAEEAGNFQIEDVFDHVNRKLVRRHPHVFGNVTADTPDDVLATWSAVKSREKVLRGEPAIPAIRYDELPGSMSVISRIRSAERGSVGHSGDQQSIDSDIGQEMLNLVNHAHELGIDPEKALERAYRMTRLVKPQKITS